MSARRVRRSYRSFLRAPPSAGSARSPLVSAPPPQLGPRTVGSYKRRAPGLAEPAGPASRSASAENVRASQKHSAPYTPAMSPSDALATPPHSGSAQRQQGSRTPPTASPPAHPPAPAPPPPSPL